MESDIVERLRNTFHIPESTICLEAAAEIERLRRAERDLRITLEYQDELLKTYGTRNEKAQKAPA